MTVALIHRGLRGDRDSRAARMILALIGWRSGRSWCRPPRGGGAGPGGTRPSRGCSSSLVLTSRPSAGPSPPARRSSEWWARWSACS
ncbi:hypothetical protein QJS66_11020 [Kocuria rhizophila]|nr:hypothetical protein QJS66_11020 [Kocuria rhizophila]